jgi:hypothetical protein
LLSGKFGESIPGRRSAFSTFGVLDVRRSAFGVGHSKTLEASSDRLALPALQVFPRVLGVPTVAIRDWSHLVFATGFEI